VRQCPEDEGQVGEVIAGDLQAFQAAGAVVQQRGADERGFAGAARAPQQHVLAGFAGEEVVEVGE